MGLDVVLVCEVLESRYSRATRDLDAEKNEVMLCQDKMESNLRAYAQLMQCASWWTVPSTLLEDPAP